MLGHRLDAVIPDVFSKLVNSVLLSSSFTPVLKDCLTETGAVQDFI